MLAVFSDLHGNAPALEAALPQMQAAEALICLGDTVGYRRRPERAMRMVQENCQVVLQGNHDAAACGQLDEFLLHIPAWLRASLEDVEAVSPSLFEWLASLQPRATWREIEMVHGSLQDPLMEFLTPDVAAQHLHLQTKRISLAGHTHRPLALSEDQVFFPSPENQLLKLGSKKWALNPGSLGILSSGQSWMELGRDCARWHFL